MEEIYLDNSATTRCLPRAAEEVKNALLKSYGNPSSLHQQGVKADELVKSCRRQAAEVTAALPEQIIFTSGGTEANNMAIMGAAARNNHRGRHIISTEIEHPSVYRPLQHLSRQGFEVSFVSPRDDGTIAPQSIKEALRPNTILASIMAVNNETGAIQPLKKIGKVIKEQTNAPLLHVDAVQALGKIGCSPDLWQADLASFSGHKIHAPKGIGFLYINDSGIIEPLLRGGDQENGLRSGTENVPGIAGLGVALKELPLLNSGEKNDRLQELREYFLQKLRKKLPSARINSPPAEWAAPHLINFSLPGVKGEVMVNALSHRDIYISTGSACHSHRNENSRILEAINLSPELLEGALRISLGRFNCKKEIDRFMAVCAEERDFLLK